MRRHFGLAAFALAALIAAAALSGPQTARPLVLDWANRAYGEVPPVAVLLEMGLKDKLLREWPGRFSLSKARLLQCEGYRFRRRDRLHGTDSWTASTHRAMRLPPHRPDLRLMEPLATVGIVFHLTDILPGAELTLQTSALAGESGQVSVPLEDVLAGHPRMLWEGNAVLRLVSAAVPLTTDSPTEDDFPAAAYGPDGTLWLVYVAYTVRDESCRVEALTLESQPARFKPAYFMPQYADQLLVRYYRDRRWSPPLPLTRKGEDLTGCAVAVEADGTAWVLYSAHREGRHNLYARALHAPRPGTPLQPEPEQKLTQGDADDIHPVACTAPDGSVHVAWQAGAGKFVIRHGRLQQGKLAPSGDRWGQEAQGSAWAPAVSAGPDRVSVAYDCYRDGDYDVAVDADPIAHSSRFEARPSVCWDDKGRLWIAYEEGPEQWGKDYGPLSPRKGNPLYNHRTIRVVCLQDGKLLRPMAELSPPAHRSPSVEQLQGEEHDPEDRAWPLYEAVPRQSNPRLGLDGQGRLWLTYRQKFGNRYTTVPGSYWLTYARRLDGDHWTEPIELLNSDGSLDQRPVILPHRGGGVIIFHNGDGRYVRPQELHSRIYASYLTLPGERVEPKLVPAEAPDKKDAAPKEHEAVQRARDFRVRAGTREYRLLRGEFHRHTDISWDGGSDGSLEDMFRYALDAAALDWIGNGDHDNGHGREYSWWLTQKLTDAYHLPHSFTTMFSYERSVSWPMGHRNCVFAERGVRTLPRLEEPNKKKQLGGVHADDTKMLYRYLHELGGICAVHTSATGMGTDWRDNDAAVEPVVEIYQGDRMSYEKRDAPRTGHSLKSGKLPINLGGWRPKGYVNRALEKGYRLGFESSSDHWSTHISYATVLAERNDRASILDALRQRHCYAATDNIALDVHSGEHIMGDAFSVSGAASLQIHVLGTGPLQAVDVLRDSDVIATLHADGAELAQNWTDPHPAAGTHYYYIRIEQKDGQLAWSSPLWIETGK